MSHKIILETKDWSIDTTTYNYPRETRIEIWAHQDASDQSRVRVDNLQNEVLNKTIHGLWP